MEKTTYKDSGKKHMASPRLVERVFTGQRTARDVAADLIQVHIP